VLREGGGCLLVSVPPSPTLPAVPRLRLWQPRQQQQWGMEQQWAIQ